MRLKTSPVITQSCRTLALALLCAGIGFAAHAAETLQDTLKRAAELERAEDYPAALKAYKSAAENASESSEAWAALGEHLRFYTHDYPAAEAAFNKSLHAEKQVPRAAAYAWRGLGELEIKNNRPGNAIENFQKSAAVFPLADTYRSLCHLYCVQRQFKAASDAARRAVELEPDDAIARLLYAAQLHRAGEPEKARAEFQQALASSGLSPTGEAAGPVHCCILYNAAGYLSVCG